MEAARILGVELEAEAGLAPVAAGDQRQTVMDMELGPAARASWECVVKNGRSHNVRSAPGRNAPVVETLSAGQRVDASGPLQGDWLPIGGNRWTMVGSGSRFTRSVYLEYRAPKANLHGGELPGTALGGEDAHALSKQHSREVLAAWGDDAHVESHRSRRRRLESGMPPHIAAMKSLSGFCKCYTLVDGRHNCCRIAYTFCCTLFLVFVFAIFNWTIGLAEGWAEERAHYISHDATYGANYTTLSQTSVAGTCTVQQPCPSSSSECKNGKNPNPKAPGSKDEFELRIVRGRSWPDVRLVVRGPCYGEVTAGGSKYVKKPVRPLLQSNTVWMDPHVSSRNIEVQCKDKITIDKNGSPAFSSGSVFFESTCPMIAGDISPAETLATVKDIGPVSATLFACVLLCLGVEVSVLVIGWLQLQFHCGPSEGDLLGPSARP